MSYHALRADGNLVLADDLNGSTSGTVTGTTTYSSGLYGRQGFSFDGSTRIDYASVASVASGAANNITAFIRIKPSSVDSTLSAVFTIANKCDANLYSGTNGISGSIQGTAGTAFIGNGALGGAGTNLIDGSWHSFAITATTGPSSNDDVVKFWTDGVERLSGTGNYGPYLNTASPTPRLGRFHNLAAGRNYFGLQQEFLLFNRALSGSELLELQAGPEPTNTVAPTFNATTGAWTVGTWDSYSNGSLTYTVLLKDDADDSTVATLQTDSATTSGNCLSDLVTAGAGTYYIEVVAANDGGDSDAEQSATSVYAPTTVSPILPDIAMSKLALFDAEAIGDLTPTFARAAATVDARGVAVASGAIRYRNPVAHTDPGEWTSTGVDVSAGASGWIGTGLNQAGIPCGVIRDSATPRLIYLEGRTPAIVRTRTLTNTTGWNDTLQETVSTYVFENGVSRYYPTSAVCHFGAIVLQCVRYQQVDVLGWTAVGTTLGLSNDGLATIEWTDLPRNSAAVAINPVVPADTGIHRGAQWSLGSPFPVDGKTYHEAAWLPFADYLDKNGFPRGGQAFLARLDRTGRGPWTLAARVIHDRWDEGDNGGQHLHSVATTTTGLLSSWGDVAYRNFIGYHELDLTSPTWLTDSVGAMTMVHGGWSDDSTLDNPSPQPAACAPTSTAGLSCWAADLESDAAVMLMAYDSEASVPLTLRSARKRIGRTGSVFKAGDPLHLRYVPECGYVMGYGSSQLYVSDNGIDWADLAKAPEDVRVWPWGRDKLIVALSTGVLWTAPRNPIRTRRTAQISPGGYSRLRNASHSDQAVSALFTSDPGVNRLTRIKYVAGVWRFAETLNGYTLDAAVPAELTPHAPPAGVDIATEVHCYLMEATKFNVAGRRLFLGNANRGCLVTHVYPLTANSPYIAVRPHAGGGQTGSQSRMICTDYRDWSQVVNGITSLATGSLEMWVYCGTLSGQATDVKAILIVEGYRTIGDQPRYFRGPNSPDTLNPDELLSVAVGVDMAAFAMRLCWTVPRDYNSTTATYDLAWLWADANNFIKFTLDQQASNVSVLSAAVTVGGTLRGTVTLSGNAFVNDSIDCLIAIDGTAIKFAGRVGQAGFVTDSDTLSLEPTEVATALRFYGAAEFYTGSGLTHTQEVLGVATRSLPIDVTDLTLLDELPLSDAPIFTTAPTLDLIDGVLTFSSGVAESQAGGEISYTIDLVRDGLVVDDDVTSPLSASTYGEGAYAIRVTATDDTAHDAMTVAYTASASFSFGSYHPLTIAGVPDMIDLGPLTAGEPVYFTFPSVARAGGPAALTGAALAVYKDGSATQVTTGLTLTANYDSVTGLNHVAIVTTDAFYEEDAGYTLVFTAGTVDAASLIGATLARFRLVPAVVAETPLAERPSAPNRTRKVKRTLGGGLTFAEIVLREGDTNVAWCLDFSSDLSQGTGIASVEAPTFDQAGATATSATRTGDRPSKGEVLLLNGVTAGSYVMTQEVTYGDSQGVQVVEGPVTVKARTSP